MLKIISERDLVQRYLPDYKEAELFLDKVSIDQLNKV